MQNTILQEKRKLGIRSRFRSPSTAWLDPRVDVAKHVRAGLTTRANCTKYVPDATGQCYTCVLTWRTALFRGSTNAAAWLSL
jgi:hypothetical protein